MNRSAKRNRLTLALLKVQFWPCNKWKGNNSSSKIMGYSNSWEITVLRLISKHMPCVTRMHTPQVWLKPTSIFCFLTVIPKAKSFSTPYKSAVS